jgi:cysteine desulfurase
VSKRRVYLDNNATTPVLPEVFEAMRPYFSERFGNASSIHHHGQDTRAAVEHARDSVAALLGCRAALSLTIWRLPVSPRPGIT